MDSRALTTLRRVEQNDDTLYRFQIGGTPIGAVAEFDSSDSDDYSRLGVTIGNDTHLKTLIIVNLLANSLTVEDREYYDGLKRNSSIQQVHLVGNILNNNNNNLMDMFVSTGHFTIDQLKQLQCVRHFKQVYYVSNVVACGDVWVSLPSVLDLSFCSTSDDVQHINICQQNELSSNP